MTLTGPPQGIELPVDLSVSPSAVSRFISLFKKKKKRKKALTLLFLENGFDGQESPNKRL